MFLANVDHYSDEFKSGLKHTKTALKTAHIALIQSGMSKVKEFKNHYMKLDGELLLTTDYVIEKRTFVCRKT